MSAISLKSSVNIEDCFNIGLTPIIAKERKASSKNTGNDYAATSAETSKYEVKSIDTELKTRSIPKTNPQNNFATLAKQINFKNLKQATLVTKTKVGLFG